MPRLISFSKTTEKVRQKRKTVTRRQGWETADEGQLLRPVEKIMGLEKGESPTNIFDDGTHIEIVDVRREKLGDMICGRCDGHGKIEGDEVPRDQWSEYDNLLMPESGRRIEIIDCDECEGSGTCPPGETAREGFPDMVGMTFVEKFRNEMGVDLDDEVTRMEFRYVKR